MTEEMELKGNANVWAVMSKQQINIFAHNGNILFAFVCLCVCALCNINI